MKTTIFTKSYSNDAEWLYYLLRSIQKFCTGYHRVVVVSEHDMSGLVESHGFDFLPCKGSDIDGYMWQQVIKMHADEYATDTDWIMFADSDCVFTGNNTPETWIKNGKPYFYLSAYEKLKNERIWKKPTEDAVGLPWDYDTTHDVMLFSKKHLVSTRERIEQLHGKSVTDYIISKTPGRQFSEFNAIGTWAKHKFPKDFTFIDKKGTNLPYFPCKNHWSWGGVKDEIRDYMEDLLK